MNLFGARKVRLVFNALIIHFILVIVVGCGQKTGGGSRSVVAGKSVNELVYGIRTGMKLGFVMFTDIPSEGTRGSAGSAWKGYIKPEKGRSLDFNSSSDGLIINGTEYKYSKGRVFLVSTKGAAVLVEQLNTPIGELHYELEISRIEGLNEVQKFLTK